MSVLTRALAALRRISIVVAIATVFLLGLVSTVYLSLRSPEVTVPEVLGKDRFEAERILGDAGLNFRVRATRPSNQLKPDTVLFQLPRAGEVVKAGQTVAMDISRAARAGEASQGTITDQKAAEEKANDNRNANADTANTNQEKPKRTRNKNANDNDNANGNTNANPNANANRPSANANASPRNANVSGTPGANSNRDDERRTVSPNVNARTPAPRPSPSANDNRR